MHNLQLIHHWATARDNDVPRATNAPLSDSKSRSLSAQWKIIYSVCRSLLRLLRDWPPPRPHGTALKSSSASSQHSPGALCGDRRAGKASSQKTGVQVYQWQISKGFTWAQGRWSGVDEATTRGPDGPLETWSLCAESCTTLLLGRIECITVPPTQNTDGHRGRVTKDGSPASHFGPETLGEEPGYHRTPAPLSINSPHWQSGDTPVRDPTVLTEKPPVFSHCRQLSQPPKDLICRFPVLHCWQRFLKIKWRD